MKFSYDINETDMLSITRKLDAFYKPYFLVSLLRRRKHQHAICKTRFRTERQAQQWLDDYADENGYRLHIGRRKKGGEQDGTF